MLLMMIVLFAWVTLFIPMPRWLFVTIAVLACSFGALLVVGGGCSYWWNSHMQPSRTGDALYPVLAGCALMLSPMARKLRPLFGMD